MPESIEGKVVLVTGAAKRIGRGIAIRLAREGARVLVHYHTSEKEAWELQTQIGAELFKADLESVAEITAMFRGIRERVGKLDALVNNAARFTQIDALKMTESDWDYIHSVNLKATFFCCQQGALLMREHGGGRIVNISSMGGIRPWPEHVHYCASKAGVIQMTRALSLALAPEITVNSVAPGVIPFEDGDKPRIRALVEKTPAGRAGTADEIAGAVVYFLTATKFVTGQVITIDGGLSQR
jgi:NAD(P)-dependent dehydrogenase (short-subunit alcohol dehydrogenase family)